MPMPRFVSPVATNTPAYAAAAAAAHAAAHAAVAAGALGQPSVAMGGGSGTAASMVAGTTTAVAPRNTGVRASPVVRLIPSASASSSARDSPRRPDSRRDTDSPTVRDRYKEFSRGLREQEKISYAAATEFFDNSLPALPERSRFRAFLDMADIAKRDNHIVNARFYFEQASRANPQASQVWLEWAKLEEECGDLKTCQTILKRGLVHCPLTEALLVKTIKHEERLGNVVGARMVLSQLLHSDMEKTWRMISEGAMLEARLGRVGVARRFFRFLMQIMPAHGPIFFDAVKLEERAGNLHRALAIAEQGLSLVPRYGPLWFTTLRLQEKLATGLSDLRVTAARALQVVSRELVWKVWYERAQFESRMGLLLDARAAYAHAVRFCPENLRWKIWLGSARTELSDGHLMTARSLLQCALSEVPRKTRAVVLLERSRLEEYDGKIDTARDILQQACTELRHEWKIFLESVLLEYRSGRVAEAVVQGQRALECHPGTGRLWALLIQLHQNEGELVQQQIFRRALQQVPKSGEVWCEGARTRLNPLSAQFDLSVARRFLDFAIQFTPQYGDSFVEYMRLELLQTGSTRALHDLLRAGANADPNYGSLWCHCKQGFLDNADQVLQAAHGMLLRELYDLRTLYTRALLRFIRYNSGGAVCLPCEVVAEPMSQLAHRPGSLCALCREPIDMLPVVALACEHCFHEVCAKKHAHPQMTATVYVDISAPRAGRLAEQHCRKEENSSVTRREHNGEAKDDNGASFTSPASAGACTALLSPFTSPYAETTLPSSPPDITGTISPHTLFVPTSPVNTLKAKPVPMMATTTFHEFGDRVEKSCPLCSEPWCVVHYYLPSYKLESNTFVTINANSGGSSSSIGSSLSMPYMGSTGAGFIRSVGGSGSGSGVTSAVGSGTVSQRDSFVRDSLSGPSTAGEGNCESVSPFEPLSGSIEEGGAKATVGPAIAREALFQHTSSLSPSFLSPVSLSLPPGGSAGFAASAISCSPSSPVVTTVHSGTPSAPVPVLTVGLGSSPSLVVPQQAHSSGSSPAPARHSLPVLPSPALRTASGLSSAYSQQGLSSHVSVRGSGCMVPSAAPIDDDDTPDMILDIGSELMWLVCPPRRPPQSLFTRLAELQLEDKGYCPHDFVTGLVQLNREYCHVSQKYCFLDPREIKSKEMQII